MQEDHQKQNTQLKLERAVARFLRYGVFTAGLLLLTATLGRLASSPRRPLDLAHYQPVPLERTIAVARSEGDWSGLVAIAGLSLLVSLPLIRVGLTAVLFAAEKDKILAFCAAFVFIALSLSLFLGLHIS